MASQTRARVGAIAVASALFATGCMAGENHGDQAALGSDGADDGMNGAATGAPVAHPVVITNLSSDQTNVAPNVAPSMVNAWGIVAYNGMFWIADAGTGKISIVDGKGVPATGKPASGALDLGEGITGIAATGVAAGDMTMFQIHQDNACAAAQLIVASEDGKLFGINPDLTATGGLVVVDRSKVAASYKGVAVVQGSPAPHGGPAGRGPLILAADFHNARIDVFDAGFALVTTPSFTVPGLPAGFAPFNVMAFGNTIYVTYAMQDADKADEVAGAGLGVIAAFDPNGKLLGTLKGAPFNAPWGMAMTTTTTGLAAFPGALLVGNFGDGAVTAIDPVHMTVLGQLLDATGAPAKVEGLWGLALGDTVRNARADGLYFAAGPEDEMHGLFGVIAPAP